jgi:hypothetical protein
MPRLLSAVIGCAGFTLPLSSSAADAVLRSGPAQVALVELYTSEGCSSCPPAEKWLGELKDAPALWRDFVPVAFHVNYWDHLGWKDALASQPFTAREHAYAEAWRASSVYTPCFVRNGEEWRPRGSPAEGRGRADAGSLTLRWRATDTTCLVDYTPAAGTKPGEKFEIAVALLGGGIVNDVRRGENSGRTLRHEFVALRLETRPLTVGEGGPLTASVVLAPRPEIKTGRRGLAAWVTRHGSLTPIQAAGGWIE